MRTASVTAFAAASVALASSLEARQDVVRQALIVNNCPEAINVFQGDQFEATVPTGTNITRPISEGFWYTDANSAGIPRSSLMRGIIRSDGIYYMVVDPNQRLNAGMRITPLDTFGWDGYCANIACESNTCGAFTSPPTQFPDPNAPVAPTNPFFQCYTNRYQITFCPSGQWAKDGSSQIRPSSNLSKCLDVRGALFENGTPVQVYDCNGTPAQKWELVSGETKVRLSGTNFCLDAGSAPANGVGMKIWQCYDNLAAQAWSWNFNRQLRLQGSSNQCLDLPEGNSTNSQQVQTWECNTSNPNQNWDKSL